MTALVAGLAIAVGLLAVLVAGLLRSHADILRELHTLRADHDAGRGRPFEARPDIASPRTVTSGSRAADIVGVDTIGDVVRVGIVGADHSTLVLFLSTGCLTCRSFWDAMADPEAMGLRAGIRVIAVTKGEEAESPAAVRDLAPDGALAVMSSDAWDAYDVPVAPYAVLVDGPSGRVVGEGSGVSWEQVRGLMLEALEDASIAERPPGGRTYPSGGTGRMERTDDALRDAGILPGDPRLFHDVDAEDPVDDAGGVPT